MFGVFVRALAGALALFPALAFAQSSPLPGFPPGVFQSRAAIDAGGGPPPSASYAFQGVQVSAPLGGNWTFSNNIGTAAANRLIIVCVASQGTTTGVTVNGVALTQAINPGGGPSLWYGLVTSGSGSQSITVAGGVFFANGAAIYSVVGLGTNSPQSTSGTSGNATTNISVTAGDFLFACENATSAPSSWSASTQTPANTFSDTSTPLFINGADWTVASTNASFLVSAPATSGTVVAANFH